jgi:hypothetical protein
MVSLLATTSGSGFTVTVATVVAVQFPKAPVIVYDCVLAGLAVTVAPFAGLKPVAGLHVYVLAPFAVSVVDPPAQMLAPETFTFGLLITVTVVVSLSVHPFTSVAKTV